jgi:hypothetical protein
MGFTNHIIDSLARFGFKQAIQDYVFKHQSKSYQDNMALAFIDSKNRKYFSFPDLKQLPLPLLEKLNELQEQLTCKVPGRDLDKWIENVELLLNGNDANKLTKLGHWIEVLKARREILFEPTILMEIAALLYIREDEQPAVYNAAIHKEKFELLWNDSQKGGKLYDFFQQAGLSQYIPSQNITAENWQQSLEVIMGSINKFNSALTHFSTSVSEFNKLDSSLQKT